MLQGLLVCSECRYAYYGKTIRQKGRGGFLKDFIYYRCSGTDRYRFGGERICDNPQIQGEFIGSAVWKEVCNLLKNPERLELEHRQNGPAGKSSEDLEILKSHLGKLQRGVERLIDSYSEGAIDKDQFKSRLGRTKSRIAEVEARIRANAENADEGQELRSLVDHYRKLAAHLGSRLEDADWDRRREAMRSLVERIEIGRATISIVFRVPEGIAFSTKDPVTVTFSHC